MFFPKFVYMTKNTPFFPIFHVFAPLNDVRAYSAWSWKTTLITWIFGRAWYPPWHSSGPPGAMSQSSWQIGRPDLSAFFFNRFFFSEQQRCQIWIVHSFEIWNLILDEQDARQNTEMNKSVVLSCILFIQNQDTRQNTELNKSVVQSVSLCLSYLFLYILTSATPLFLKHCGIGHLKN